MQIKKAILFFVLSIILVANAFAQSKEKPKILNYVVSEMCYKGALPINGEQLQSVDIYYLAYEVGVNFVYAKYPYMFVGLGAGQLFFTNSEKEMLNINLSFGIKL